ncbi:MAG: acylhydrolase [Maribacter sp.]|nr:acylhydrolase [Maribacter sp.]
MMLRIIFLVVAVLGITHLQAQDNSDWPNLKRYEMKNDSIKEIENRGDRIVFMGNSITEGWAYHMPEYMNGTPYINRGISGQTTPQMLIRMYPDVVDLKPVAVVILAGTNDIAGNTGPSTIKMIMDNIKGMAEIANANNIKVILASVLPAFDYPWKPGMGPNEKIPALNAMIKSYAAEKGHVYLDYFGKMNDGNNGLKADLGSDGVHPNKKGYAIMAEWTEKAIQKAIQ